MSDSIVGALRVVLGMDTAEFEEGVTSAERKMKRLEKNFSQLGSRMTAIGTRLTIGVTAPLVALGKAAVDGFVAQEKAMADVEAALKSMGGASGKTAKELLAASDAMELESLYDGDVILKQVTANLLTFGNVAGAQFDRAQQAAVDMATRLGTEPQSAAIMLGKALNDPIKGITALTRVGVQFTDKQRAQIKAMTETGNVAGAQGVILAEVERQFKGAAAAAADATPWRKAQVAIGQAGDVIGEAILPIIKPAAEAIASLARSFAQLSPGMQQAAVIGGILAAALGPVLIALGGIIQLAAPVIAGLTTLGGIIAGAGGLSASLAAAGAAAMSLLGSLAAIVAPVAAVAAAGYLIYQNWDKIAPVLDELWQTLQTTLGPPLRELIGAITSAFSELWNGPIGSMLKAAGARLIEFEAIKLKVFGPVFIALLKVVIQTFVNVAKTIGDAVHLVSSLLKGDWSEAAKAAGSIVDRIFGGMPGKVIGWMQQLVTGVRTWVVDKLGQVWTWVTDKIETVKKSFFNLYDAVVGHSYIPDLVDGIAAQMQRLDAVMVDPAKKAATATAEAMREMAGEVQALLDRLFPDVRQLLDYQKDLDLLDRADLTDAQREEARRRLGLEAAGYGGKEGIEVRAAGTGPLVTADGVKKQTEEVAKATGLLADKTRIQTVRIAESFKDMAEKTIGALQGLVNSIKGGSFLDILGAAVNLVLQLGSTGLFGKTIQGRINAPRTGGYGDSVPRYASGGSFAFGGVPGVDRNLLSLNGTPIARVSKGEVAHISPANRANPAVVKVLVGANDYFDARVQSVSGGVLAETSDGIMRGGAMLAQRRLAKRQSRRVG